MARKKGLDRTFLHYGVREDDMSVIVSTCQKHGVDPEWFKEFMLKPYNNERNDQNVVVVDPKKMGKILKKALKNSKPHEN